MRSKIAQKILNETPDSIKSKIRDYASKQIERNEFLAISKRLKEDDAYVDQYLIENGYDPKKLAEDGIVFLRSLFEKHDIGE